MGNTTILIVDDHDIFRDGLTSLILMRKLSNRVLEASNGREFLAMLPTVMPDIVLLDIAMPELNGIEAARLALEKYPNLNIIVLSMFGDEEYYNALIELGVKGFLLKTSGKAELETAIKTVLKGGNYFSADLLQGILDNYGKSKTKQKVTHNIEPLSEREVNIIELMGQGLSTNEIADLLCLSKKTIEGHRSKLLLKTNTKNSIDLVVYAIKNQLIKL
jgi:DNA-binding NarL/FixJ family response regulator